MATRNLSQIAAAQERAVLRAFTESVQSVKDQAVIAEIVRALEVGNVDAVVRLLGLDEARFEPLEEAIRQSYREGGLTGAAQVGRIPTDAGTLVARFNVRNPRAEQWLVSLSSNRIVEIAEESRTVVRNVLTANLMEGANPRTAALDLVGRIDPVTRRRTGGFIGLTTNQAEWVANARRDLETLNPNYLTRKLRDRRLDAAFERALATGEPLTAKQIDTAVSRYQARALRYRGENISRTESINALRAGQHEAIQQAIEVGEIETQDAMKEWDSSGDQRTRDDHFAADGQRVPFDQPFIVGGEALMFPGDPNGSAGNVINCRCRERTVIDFAGQLKRIEGFR